MIGLKPTAIVTILIVACAAGVMGVQRLQMLSARHRADAAERTSAEARLENARLAAALADARESERIVTQYVDCVQVVRERGETIIKEVPVHVTPQADRACVIPAGFVGVHDAAAQNLPLVPPAGNPDAPAAGITLSTVADTVVGNYTVCHAIREQLIALRAFERLGHRDDDQAQ